MRVVGLFRELITHPDAGAGTLMRDVVDVLSASKSQDVVAYLERGIQLTAVMGWEADVLLPWIELSRRRRQLWPSEGIPGGASLNSDGYWIWRTDLPFYVGKYRIGLDSAFLETVLNCHRRRPPDLDDVLSRADVINRVYEDYAKTFRTP